MDTYFTLVLSPNPKSSKRYMLRVWILVIQVGFVYVVYIAQN